MNNAAEPNGYMRAGITLVEMLISLSLLSVLILIAVSWMSMILNRQEHDQRQTRWERSSLMVLDQIARDITQFDIIDETRRHRESRLWIENGSLNIRTTDQGRLTTLRYAFDPERMYLVRGGTIAQGQLDSHFPILGQVSAFVTDLSHPNDNQSVPVLKVRIQGLSGQVHSRSYVLRREDVAR